MNNGAFGENFPYSNFHDLNMDWIIKIAKDFLDQYSHIQETIQNGLDDLDAKATELEGLLQEWYDTHSQDIADQLADALADLNEWYTEHQNYLDQYVQDSVTAFQNEAEAKALETIQSIPSDYTELYNSDTYALHDFIKHDITVNSNNILMKSERNKITLTGTPSANTGLILCDNISSPLTFPSFVSGHKYYIKWENVPITENVFLVVAYKETSADSFTELIHVETRNLTSRSFATQFEYPATVYQFRIALTAIRNWTFNSVSYLSVMDCDNLYNLIEHLPNSDNDITIINNKLNTLPYNYNSFTQQPESVTLNGLVIERDFNKFKLTGTPTINSQYDFIIDDGTIFKPNETIFLDYTGDVSTFLQVFVKETASSSLTELLTTRDSGVYKITFPSQVTYVRINLTFIVNTVHDNTILLSIDKYHAKTNKIFYTSQYDNSLMKTVKEAEKWYGATVILNNESYDLVQEFIDFYGETFFSNYNTDPHITDGRGLAIRNGMTLRAITNSVINCDPSQYASSTNRIYMYFSPIDLADDCTIENLTINAYNTKYCIHDDWLYQEIKAKHVIRNCRLTHIGSGLRCIGGGLSVSREVIIEDCWFYASGNPYPVHYHNSAGDDAKSSIWIKNCYFENGGIGLTNYGTSTKPTYIYISGNSYRTEPEVGYESEEYHVENMFPITWNNELRQ